MVALPSVTVAAHRITDVVGGGAALVVFTRHLPPNLASDIGHEAIGPFRG